MALTPMMQQYLDLKKIYDDCILFFRLGDFYEMFFEDAKTASKVLEIALTGRDCGMEERAPMCGVPFHAADTYIQKLVQAGYKVAIAEQMEDPSIAKGIVKRDVIKVVTPGTVTEAQLLDEKKNNYLCCVYKLGGCYGLAAVDISTGKLQATSVLWGDTRYRLIDQLARFNPSEVCCTGDVSEDTKLINIIKNNFNSFISVINSVGSIDEQRRIVNKYFADVEIKEDRPEFHAVALLLEYLEMTQKVSLDQLDSLEVYAIDDFMGLDASSRANLELTQNLREKGKKGTLLWVLDKTMTAMGARKLRSWVEQPLLNKDLIEYRLNAVENLFNKFMVRSELRELLKMVYDIERISTKLVYNNINCRDLISMKRSFSVLPDVKTLLDECDAPYLKELNENIDKLDDLYTLIENAIVEEPPLAVTEGQIIKDGYDAQVDEYREAKTMGNTWIEELVEREKEATGIKNLKIGYNRIFGYYIEVTRSYFDLVPETYIRKQTLANCERFITEELKEIEDKLLSAQEKLVQLEYKLFVEIRDEFYRNLARIKTTAEALAALDTLASFAEVAEREDYCKPVLNEEKYISIKKGRHPVVEKTIVDGEFISNDALLNDSDQNLAIITGPNMAGKSTFMRQTALICLMAQVGSFVPAKEATLGIVDKIFTRIGASDNLASGQSTFMVEMTEMANILKNATSKSLLILDEVGRGTSTFDGLSIAWAVLEYLMESSQLKPRTLFATHYHELTELEGKLSGVKNFSVSIKESGDDIIFLHKIVRGGADGSFGIQVAALADLPDWVISRAKEILVELENEDVSNKSIYRKRKTRSVDDQMDIFSLVAATKASDELIDHIKNLDLSNMTPIDALKELFEIQNKLK